MKLYAHQQRAFDFMKERDFGAGFMETGTGKTLVSLKLLLYWEHHEHKTAIVVAPNTVTPVWLLECEKWDIPLRIKRLEGSSEQRVRQIQKHDADILVINYEGLRSAAVMHALIALHPGVLILDEIQKVKNRKAIQASQALELAREVKSNYGHVLGLTGTPIVHSPLDLWSEFNILSPSEKPTGHVLGYGGYYAFEQAVAITKPHPRLGNRVKLYEFPDERLAALKKRVAPHAVEASKAECLDLPPRNYTVVRLPMLPEQAKVYKALAADYIATLDGVLPPDESTQVLREFDLSPLLENDKALEAFYADMDTDGQTELPLNRRISVTFAATLMTRLQQVAAGHIKSDDGTTHSIYGCKEEWLEENLPVFTAPGWDHKCVIFCRFKADVEILKGICERLDIGYVTLTGENSKHAGETVRTFQTDPGTRVFIGNVSIASTGITLTAGDRIIFYTNSFAWGDRSQAEDRTYRIGQTRVCEYYDLVATTDIANVDDEALSNLQNKQNMAFKTVGDLRAALGGVPT
jgi:SNF2 family DNA or RNA helicase